MDKAHGKKASTTKIGNSRAVKPSDGYIVVPGASGTSAFSYYANNEAARKAASARFRAVAGRKSTKATRQSS
jgi:hypothetical protein